jgi:hypothetical protein
MTTHQITSQAGWFQVVETDAEGTVALIGSFRTETDAREWLNAYLRMRNGTEIFKVGYSEACESASAATEAPVSASDSS